VRRASFYALAVVSVSLLAVVCERAQDFEWRVQLKANSVAPSGIEATNDCKRTHTFQIVPDSLPYMRLMGPDTFDVAPGASYKEPVQFDTRSMQVGQYDAVLTVKCLTCKSEPGCKEDHKNLHVYLTVMPGTASWTEIHPEQKGSVKDNPELTWSDIHPESKPQ